MQKDQFIIFFIKYVRVVRVRHEAKIVCPGILTCFMVPDQSLLNNCMIWETAYILLTKVIIVIISRRNRFYEQEYKSLCS